MTANQTPPVDPAEAFGARFQAALRYARLKPSDLHRRLERDYGMKVSRATVYDAFNGRVARPKYAYEAAEITGVNLAWLLQGRGVMVDLSGRKSTKEQADHAVRNLLRQNIIPARRNDLIRVCDRFLDKLVNHQLDETSSQSLDEFLSLIGADQDTDSHQVRQILRSVKATPNAS